MKKINFIVRAENLREQAQKIGFDWVSTEQILEQILSEVKEIQDVIKYDESPARFYEETGDLLYACLDLCLFNGLNPAKVMKQSLDKFEKRFKIMVKLMQEKNVDTFEGKIDKALAFWHQAKSYGAAGED